MKSKHTAKDYLPFARLTSVSRRNFLEASAAVAGMAFVSPNLMGEEPATPTPSDLVPGKDNRLVVRKVDPIVMGTPDTLLREKRLTPKQFLFVRNNYMLEGFMNLDPKPLKGWTVEFTGHLDKTKTLNATELEDLPHVEHELVLQCSGNGRSLFSKFATTTGTQWGRGAVGNVRFAGVSLSTVLKHLGIKPTDAARFLTAEGVDAPATPESPDFEHSILLSEALDRSLLATHMNGEPIPAVHGGPVRLITPGYYATMNVKWVTRLRFESDETSNEFQIPKYRTPRRPIKPGQEYDFTFDNSDPNWDMRIKSRLLKPATGSKVASGMVEVSGVAWNDGMTALVAVEVSTDEGKTWRRANLKRADSPFAWHDWFAQVRLKEGKQSVWCRAIDALGHTQPIDGSIYWNERGYTWNEVDKITLDVG